MARSAWTWTFVGIIASGCLGGTAPAVGNDASASSPFALPSDTTGAIDVLVLDPELAPIAGAQVVIDDTELSALTDAAGSARFADIEPGPYTVVAAKAGHRAQQPQGRVVEVVSGEVSEVRLTMEPVVAVTAATSYETTLLFRGFISCSAEWIRVAVLANRTQCGKGVDAAGTNVGGDPNENATHPWMVENSLIQSIVLEAEWQPSLDAAGRELYFATQTAYTCSVRSCQYSNEVQTVGGSSPLYAVAHEGSTSKITGSFGNPDAPYPRPIWTVGRTFCGPDCVASITLQQTYDVVVTAFYGREAPPDWRALE